MLFAAGLEVGQYRIESKLGEGGMSTVYLALDTKLQRQVAIKFLSDHLADAEARRRFQREAQMASSLNHPHIVTVHDVGEFEGRQYLVMECVDGGTLKDWAKEKKRTPKESDKDDLLEVIDEASEAFHQALGWGDLNTKLLASLAAGSPPDLTHLNPFMTASLFASSAKG